MRILNFLATLRLSTREEDAVAAKESVALIKTSAPYGFTGVSVQVETDIRAGLPSFQIVGMGSKAVDEARQRVRSAVLNSNLSFPAKKVIINLSPADLPKDGTHFDLPIAVSILQATGQLSAARVNKAAFAGELSLNGRLLPIRGATLIAESAKKAGATTLYVPLENYHQASLIEGVTTIAARSLREVVQHLYGGLSTQEPPLKPPEARYSATNPYPSLDTIAGQEAVKRALALAVAGRHNILLYGPPGTGKTHLARAAAGLLPPLSPQEAIEVTKIHSLTDNNTDYMHTPPFRAPHHSVTRTALIGGGLHPRPGDISLAHKGVLLLDELPEYPRGTLEALRQPLEDKIISLSRLYGSVTYPADVLLIATMNPCPCGFYGDPEKECRCTAAQMALYSRKLSGPLLDRIDLYVHAPRVLDEYFFDTKLLQKNQHATVVDMINGINILQRKRYKRSGCYNGNASGDTIKAHFHISSDAHEMMKKAQRALGLSGRGVLRTLRVARTVADASDSPTVTPPHIAEALQFRSKLE